MASANETIGLYRYCAVAGNAGTPGAPILHLSLLVNAASGKVTGQAVRTQAVAPPGNEIHVSNVEGQMRATGFGEYTKVMALRGTAVVSVPPPAIGTYLLPFEAHFALHSDLDGAGGWTLGNTEVNDVRLQSEDC